MFAYNCYLWRKKTDQEKLIFRLDHIPTDLVERVAPALNAHANRIASLPAVQAYYAGFAGK